MTTRTPARFNTFITSVRNRLRVIVPSKTGTRIVGRFCIAAIIPRSTQYRKRYFRGLSSGLLTVIKYFYVQSCMRAYLARKYVDYLERKAQRKLYSNPEIRQFLESIKSPSTGCSYSDYWLLYSHITRNKPHEVLELGSGISTVILAIAAKETGSTRITSMEESEHYFAETKKIIPDHLLQFVDLQYSKSVEYRYGPFCGVAYAEIPHREFDLVFVDGPQYDAETSFDADVIELARRQDKPFTYIVDSRTGSCWIYHAIFSTGIKFSYLQRKGIGIGSKKLLRTYPELVNAQMRKRIFPRASI